ncbi:MAG: hypothetical protein KJZ53_03685 [Anaerolineales bacterium]|nr:hypothetical protein [Anaerolineales bacterium]
MRNPILLSFLCLVMLSGCGSASADTPPAPAETGPATVAAATATVAAEPTAEPSPTAAPLPYSGPNPRLAIWGYEGEQLVIRVIELGSEEVVATIPVEDSWRMALSPDGRMLFNSVSLGRVGMIYDLESGESRTIDLSAQVTAEGTLGQAVWSPSQQWLNFQTHNAGLNSLWAYSLETGDLTHVADARVVNWSSTEDIVSYVSGNLRATYDLTTGQETVWPSPRYEALEVSLTHDGLKPDFNSPACWYVCVHPELGQVRDYQSSQRSAGRYYYDLIDSGTVELLAHVATFQTERSLTQETYNPEVAKLFPLWQRGDYLLFVLESAAGPDYQDSRLQLYSAWSPAGELPFTVVEGEVTNTLPDVLPVAVSPDGTAFVGFRFTQPEDYVYLVESAVVVDLATAEILYEYSVSSESVYFLPPTEVLGAHLVWPGE